MTTYSLPSQHHINLVLYSVEYILLVERQKILYVREPGYIVGIGMAPTLSKMATNDQHGENSPYFDGWKSYDKDPFHPTRNPHGVIQMGLAENQVRM